ncbi:MAG: MBL fold metallo-hydrolase [Dehalococcoidia bacterium]|nr:MBL fold metallo-hydrolase [Dehalococcoidia bacterium]
MDGCELKTVNCRLEMQNRLTFLGAAQNVTGSCYLLEVNSTRLLVDCGLFHERELQSRNWQDFPFPPNTLQAVLLTHAHLDHSGLLPKLVREGFLGKIYCTSPTAEIVPIMLMDAAKLQEEDAQNKRRRHEREGRHGPYPEVPLYTAEDAQAVFPLLTPVKYGDAVTLAGGIKAVFRDAGHVLGSAMIQLDMKMNGDKRSLVFSGDIGRWGSPILPDPTLFSNADYVIVECTYGDRLHDKQRDIEDILASVIIQTQKAGGNLIIPSFALERTQEILYYLDRLFAQDRIPHLMVFLDSPMASSVTEVFRRHPELYDKQASDYFRRNGSPFDFPNLRLVRSVDESKTLNYIKGTAIIIAGSGMCTGGRIKHHLAYNISRRESTILFVGYQAMGTLGREIVSGAKQVRILGQKHRVRAKIVQMGGFSAHADRDELLRWLSGFERPPSEVFVTHGEPQTALSFAKLVVEAKAWAVSVPQYQDSVMLS